ncbi:MAG: hypothetical protein HY508_00845 [Acidobacteria bacterium]|nr:hypothetical protein [Acidobacteriota bacterium]
MKGLDHASHQKLLAQELIKLSEERAALKLELAAVKKGRKSAAAASRQRSLAKQIKELSSAMDATVHDIGQPPPRQLERLSGVFPVTLQVEAKGRKFEHPASTLDMTDRGLRIVTATSLIPGQTLDVFSSRALLGRCRVVWVTGGGTDRPSEVGLEILH